MNFTELLSFLRELEQHNDKEWFEAHKPRYKALQDEFKRFVADLIEEISGFDKTLVGLEPKKAVFRIYRDVRFSKNKHPYKTNFGASLAENGRKMTKAGYYIHIQPSGQTMVGGGLYMPGPEELKRIRTAIDQDATPLREVLAEKSFQDFFGALRDIDPVKTAPRGFSKDHPDIDLIRQKSFVGMHTFQDKELDDAAAFHGKIIKGAKILKPLNDYLNEVIAPQAARK
jgi:uncharacterized protein (TIGR02453 family)